MKEKAVSPKIDNETIELILCKISSAVCETEKLNDNFNELKKRYLIALRELNVANEVNRLLKKEIGNLRCREAALMGQIRKSTEESFGDEEIDERLLN